MMSRCNAVSVNPEVVSKFKQKTYSVKPLHGQINNETLKITELLKSDMKPNVYRKGQWRAPKFNIEQSQCYAFDAFGLEGSIRRTCGSKG
jgi:hypothetical protein